MGQQASIMFHTNNQALVPIVEKNPSIKVHWVADPPFFFSKSKFNFSSVSSSLVLCPSAVVGCSSLLSRVKPLAKGWFQLASVSWPSCRQEASHTPSIAFRRHLPPNSARFGYATEGAFFISSQLSTDAISALRSCLLYTSDAADER